MPAARNQRLQLDTLVENQCGSPLRTIRLVCRERHGMDASGIEAAKVDIPFAQSLNRVGMEPPTRRLGGACQRGHILHHAGFVIGQHH